MSRRLVKLEGWRFWRWSAPSLATLGLATLGLALVVSGCATTSTTGGSSGGSGSGVVKTETRNVSGFNTIAFHGTGTLNINQTGTESLTISAEDNVLPHLTSTVSSGVLTLGVAPGSKIRPTKPIIYTLTVKQLNGLSLSGVGSVTATNITTSALQVAISGSDNTTISGSAQSQTALLSGVGNYMAKDFQTENTQVTIAGAGNAAVSVSKMLTAKVSGSGTVTFYGSPQITQSITGVGTVTRGH